MGENVKQAIKLLEELDVPLSDNAEVGCYRCCNPIRKKIQKAHALPEQEPVKTDCWNCPENVAFGGICGTGNGKSCIKQPPALPEPKTGTCGRCYDEPVEVFPANCKEKPETLIGQPIGQYHCTDCGAMVVAGCKHPDLCQKCIDRKHPAFDLPEPSEFVKMVRSKLLYVALDCGGSENFNEPFKHLQTACDIIKNSDDKIAELKDEIKMLKYVNGTKTINRKESNYEKQQQK